MNKEEIEQALGDLADIIWFMKGYNVGKESYDTPFTKAHEESLRKVRLLLMNENAETKEAK